jgi:DNA invertase Pin-like site-specific DNA recombinase
LQLVETLIDNGYSASKGYHLSEGRLGSFRADAEKGKYKGYALVVSEMDRLSRQGIGETRDLLTRFTKAGLEIHIAQTNRVIRSTEDVVTELLNVLESHGAAEYSRKLSERIGKAWAAKKRNADRKVVTSIVPLWLEVVDGKIVKKPEQVEIVREMFRLAAMGLGAKMIAQKINGGLPLSTIRKTLANRAVLGEYQPCRYVNRKRVPDGEPVTDYYPAIITPSQWAAARVEVDRKNPMPNDSRRFCTKNANADNLFTGLLFDVSSKPARTLFFQAKSARFRQKAKLVSAHDRHQHRESNRFPYAKFEQAFLGYLKDLDWRSITARGKSDEEIEMEKQLDAIGIIATPI